MYVLPKKSMSKIEINKDGNGVKVNHIQSPCEITWLNLHSEKKNCLFGRVTVRQKKNLATTGSLPRFQQHP